MVSEEKNTTDQCIQADAGSMDDDFEFRDMLMQSLEKNGALAKLKATLRASMCLALDEDSELSQLEPLKNKKMESYKKTSQGKLMFAVVREFLEYFNLTETLMVYDSETSGTENPHKYGGKKRIQRELGLETSQVLNVALLEHILQVAQSKSQSLDVNLNVSNITQESIINRNSCNGTDSENSPKLLSFGEADSSKKIKNMNATYNMESPIGNSTYDVISPMINLDSPIDHTTTLISNRPKLDAVEECFMEDLSGIENTKLSKKQENVSSI